MIQLIKAIVKLFEKIPDDVIAIMARFAVGLVFFKSGLTKIEGFGLKPSTFFLFESEYTVPLLPPVVAAYAATIAELALPISLWVGLGARFSALALLVMTAVIQIFNYPNAYGLHALWSVALLYILIKGPGILSIDHMFRKKYMSGDQA